MTSSTASSPAQVPALGVVTVTYLPGKHLSAMLDSLTDATTRPTVTVLADNGPVSQRDKVRRLADGRTVRFLPTGGNLGYGAGMNKGTDLLRELIDDDNQRGAIDEEFVLITNPDVIFTPGSIDELLACAHRWPHAAAVGPRIVEDDGSTYPSARAVPSLVNGVGHALLSGIWPSNPFSASYRANEDMDTERRAGWLSGSCLLVRWEALRQVGGFDERYFMYLEDVDLGDRFQRAGYDNMYCPTAIIHHDQGHSTKTRQAAMTKAHHASAYRFLADRYPRWWQAPLRVVLKLGLSVRAAWQSRKA